MSGVPGVASPFCRTAAYRGTLPGLHALRRRIEAGIRYDHRGLSPVELRVELFHRLHGRSLDPGTVSAVEARLREILT